MKYFCLPIKHGNLLYLVHVIGQFLGMSVNLLAANQFASHNQMTNENRECLQFLAHNLSAFLAKPPWPPSPLFNAEICTNK